MIKTTRKPHHLLLYFILITLLLSGCQAAQEESPLAIPPGVLSPEKEGYVQRGMIELIPDDLSPPIKPPIPIQTDLGLQTYYQICLACHGNWGQGLTDEWREIGFGYDMNCWESKCHAPNHPPQGFEIPYEMPPVLGKGTLGGIYDAKELHQLISKTMPWWNPGSLSEEEALNLTAYLMYVRGEFPKGITLTEASLEAFSMHYPPSEIVDETPGTLILISGLSVSMLAYIWIIRSPNDEDDQQG